MLLLRDFLVFCGFFRKKNGFGGDFLPEGQVMLHKQHGGRIFQNQLFDLDAGVEIDVIQRFIPDVQMGLLAQAFGKEHLFLLSGGKGFHVLLELHGGKAQLVQQRLKETFLNLTAFCELGQWPPQTGGVLGHIGQDQAGAYGNSALVGDGLAGEQLQQAGFPGAVDAVQHHPLSLL